MYSQEKFNSLLVVVMDAVDLERVGDNVGDTIKTLATHHTAETAGMVALTTRSQDLEGRGEGEEERERGGGGLSVQLFSAMT
jgi:hypothetical protein